MISTAVMAILSLIEEILPLLGVGGQAAKLIGTIIATLVKFLPLIENEVETVYDATKNIIAALKDHPASTEDQMKALQQLDNQVDKAWDELEPALDPDAPGGTV